MTHNGKRRLPLMPAPRPTQPLFFRHCQRVRIDGVTIRNAPCWTITLALCRDVKLSHLTIDNNLRTPNCDGIHCCACKDVIITDSVISAGDDCIALTSITDWEEVCENIVVANCILTSRSAAIRIGHEASKVRNVAVSNIIVKDTNRGIAIFARDKGWVENVRIDNALIQTRLFAGGWWGKGEPLVLCARGSGRIEGISVSNVRAESENSILVVGQEKNIRDVELRDWSLKAETWPEPADVQAALRAVAGPQYPRPRPEHAIFPGCLPRTCRRCGPQMCAVPEPKEKPISASTRKRPGLTSLTLRAAIPAPNSKATRNLV